MGGGENNNPPGSSHGLNDFLQRQQLIIFHLLLIDF